MRCPYCKREIEYVYCVTSVTFRRCFNLKGYYEDDVHVLEYSMVFKCPCCGKNLGETVADVLKWLVE